MEFVKGTNMSEPVIAQKSPYGVEVEAGKDYWWCACGQSKSQPFCDGSHKGTGLSPQQYSATESAEVWFCGCKHTGAVPMCDGSHKNV
jgi:CDGSH-type Zn-finger protein|tara:strand:- start:133 stop:396 length:264 start_codon:yes stop_codon:yes gene_type:complete